MTTNWDLFPDVFSEEEKKEIEKSRKHSEKIAAMHGIDPLIDDDFIQAEARLRYCRKHNLDINYFDRLTNPSKEVKQVKLIDIVDDLLMELYGAELYKVKVDGKRITDVLIDRDENGDLTANIVTK